MKIFLFYHCFSNFFPNLCLLQNRKVSFVNWPYGKADGRKTLIEQEKLFVFQ